jgi:hypothetical protein
MLIGCSGYLRVVLRYEALWGEVRRQQVPRQEALVLWSEPWLKAGK